MKKLTTFDLEETKTFDLKNEQEFVGIDGIVVAVKSGTCSIMQKMIDGGDFVDCKGFDTVSNEMVDEFETGTIYFVPLTCPDSIKIEVTGKTNISFTQGKYRKMTSSGGGSDIELSSISIITEPTNTDYFKGETLDLTGLAVQATYSNGAVRNVPLSELVTVPENGSALTENITSVAISLTEYEVTQTATLNITVDVLTSIRVATMPRKTEYESGETIDLTGLVINAVGSNGYEKNITSECTFNPTEGSTIEEDTNVIATYVDALGDSYTATVGLTIKLGELYFEAISNNSTVQLYKVGSPSYTPAIEYKINDGDWSSYINETDISLNEGEKVFFRGNNNKFNESIGSNWRFKTNNPIKCGGNIMSLLSKDMSVKDVTQEYMFACLFRESKITTPPELPATNISNNCYYSMFNSCSNLGYAPDLPATNLKNGCYTYMFYSCRSLTKIKINYTGNFDSAHFNTWVGLLSASGDFYYNGTDTTRGSSAIPTGWTVHTF